MAAGIKKKKKKSQYKYSLVQRDPVGLGLGGRSGYEADTQVCQIRRRKKQSNEAPTFILCPYF